MNASKHLVFASEIVSQHEDQDLFNQLLERLINELNPETQIESSIVERIAANVWRERRLAIAERKWINQTYPESKLFRAFDDIAKGRFGVEDEKPADPDYGLLPIQQQLLIGRYQVMLNNQARLLLDELRREQSRRSELNTIAGDLTSSESRQVR